MVNGLNLNDSDERTGWDLFVTFRNYGYRLPLIWNYPFPSIFPTSFANFQGHQEKIMQNLSAWNSKATKAEGRIGNTIDGSSLNTIKQLSVH